MRINLTLARSKFGRGEIRVQNPDGSIQRVIPFGGSSNEL